MRAAWVKASSILLFLIWIGGAQEQSAKSVLLPSREAKHVRDFYLRGKFGGTWQPTAADINHLQSELHQIARLNSQTWGPSIHIEHPETYYQQDVGIVFNEEKVIFVNAFCSVSDIPHWRDHLVVVADGGSCFWHASYIPSTRTFFDLEINGRA